MIYQTITVDNPLPIIDGYVTYENHDLGLKLVLRVKQIKGRGTADADQLSLLNHYHIDLLNLCASIPENSQFTANQLLSWMEAKQKKAGIIDEFKDANWRRPISELYRKGILLKGTGRHYKINKEKAKVCLERGTFQ